MDKIENKFLNKLIFGKYKINKKIGIGAQSIIFSGININNKELVALKIQKKSFFINENFEKEAYYLFQLKGYGIPRIISFGHFGEYNVLIEELLGESLEDLFEKNKKKEKVIILKDMLMTGIQLIDRIEYIHSNNIVHLDIKPSNFVVGYKDPSLIYIIDFGLSKKYKSSRTGKHVIFSKRKYFHGNIEFSSVNNMRGIVSSRRDDLESIGYMLIYLYENKLPWEEIEAINTIEMARKVFCFKNQISMNTLCKNLPKEMTEFMVYIKSLKFDEKPNYNYLKNLLEIMLKKINNINDLKFSWIKEDSSRRITPIKNIKKRKSSPYIRILNNLNKCASERNVNKKKNLLNNLNIFSEQKEKKNLSNNASKIINNCINNTNFIKKSGTEKNMIIREVKSKNIKLNGNNKNEYKTFDKDGSPIIKKRYIRYNLIANNPRNETIEQINFKLKKKIQLRKIFLNKNINNSNANKTFNMNLIRKDSFNNYKNNLQAIISNYNTINNDNNNDITNLYYDYNNNKNQIQNLQLNLNYQNFIFNLKKNLGNKTKFRNVNGHFMLYSNTQKNI